MTVKRLLGLLLRIGLIVGSFTAAALLSSYLVMFIMLRGGEVVEVPNVVNDSALTALEKFDKAGLQMKSEGSEYHPIVPKDCIISQRPVPGSKVKRGKVVLVTISMGSEILGVPDVTGDESRTAEMKLKATRLDVGHVAEIHFATRKGIVIAQNPQPKDPIQSSGKVDLLVSAGPRLTKYVVPNVVGMRLDEAFQLLSGLGLEVQTQPVVRPQVVPGTVVAQDPAPNATLNEGGLVLLTVSAPSKAKRWENLRYVVVTFAVPSGFWQKLVRIEMTDPLGTETVLKRRFAPYDVLVVPISYRDRVTVKVFVDDVLMQQVEADAASERTGMFTQSWRNTL
jgi:serine/threonine-protein kinase